jgi:hypothetical protein
MSRKPQDELVLAALRTVCARLELTRKDVEWTGTALANGAISPMTAIKWIEEVAPGCLPVELKVTFLANGWGWDI